MKRLPSTKMRWKSIRTLPKLTTTSAVSCFHAKRGKLDEALAQYQKGLGNLSQLCRSPQQSRQCSLTKGAGGRGDRPISNDLGNQPQHIVRAYYNLQERFSFKSGGWTRRLSLGIKKAMKIDPPFWRTVRNGSLASSFSKRYDKTNTIASNFRRWYNGILAILRRKIIWLKWRQWRSNLTARRPQKPLGWALFSTW